MTLTVKIAAALSAALALAGCQKQDDEAFGERVRAYLLSHPEVLQEVSVAYQQKQQAELAKAASTAIGKHRAQLERDPRDFVANPNGSVTVVEFFDYNCAYCKIAAPDVVKLIRDNPDVRFVFKEFAFQTEDSILAGHMVLTPVAKPKSLELYADLMAAKPLNRAAIDRIFTQHGVDPQVARQQAGDPAIQRQLLDIRALAQALHIDGTPAFVVGDKVIPGADIDALKAAITDAKATGLKRPTGNPA
ncbi:DsbA family protein [Phenylobacterium sp. VNQ135]|uniref:DsbA family protein n=1 Tax=Phenylobacterium sp. VNQ135 TaxID=3400922 RepID=UPI003BFC3D8B